MSNFWKDEWTKIASGYIKSDCNSLLQIEPMDFNYFSTKPFSVLSQEQIVKFYTSILISMAKRESGYNTNATYTESFKDANKKNVISRGLLQLSYESVRGYGFKLNKPEDLHNPEINIRAALTIMNYWMLEDHRISAFSSVNKEYYGFARYWSVIRPGHFREEIAQNSRDITNTFVVGGLNKVETIYDKFYAMAKSQMGIHELHGKQHEKKIIEYHNMTSLKAADDETPWCSSFACWVVENSGVRSTRSASARSWMKWGKELKTPVKGCIVVFTRTGGGHVSFYDHEDKEFIYCLGGNQGDMVCIAAYRKARLLGYRGVA